MKINKIYNENCLITMSNMPSNYIDLTVTSPPYDNLREYKGFFNFFLSRILLMRLSNYPLIKTYQIKPLKI